MRVWLVTIGEPLPTDSPAPRLLRAGLLAQALTKAGHDVVWWTSTFDTIHGTFRFDRDASLTVEPRLEIRLLHAGGYTRNISVQRHRHHRRVAKMFATQALMDPRPDIIVCSLPILELCDEAVDFGRRAGVPVVVDVRDLWPDLLLERAPASLRGLAAVVAKAAESTAVRACRGATAITGVTDEYVQWGIEHAGRPRTPLDQSFPHGYPDAPPAPDALRAADDFWTEEHGITLETSEFVVCFFGALGPNFDLRTVIAAAKTLEDRGQRGFRFVLCGSGPDLETCRRLSRGLRTVVLPGWVDAAQIWSLMRMSSAGLACYESTPNFVSNVPNKPIEYLSAGLPVVSSLEGALARLLREHGCGLTYANGDARALAECLVLLRDDSAVRCAMSEAARQLFRTKFVADKVYAGMTRHLELIATSEA